MPSVNDLNRHSRICDSLNAAMLQFIGRDGPRFRLALDMLREELQLWQGIYLQDVRP